MPAILAIVIAVILFVILLKLVVLLAAVGICVVLGAFIYLTATRLIGAGR